MNDTKINNPINEVKPFDSVQVINKYAIYSTIQDDPIFQINKNKISEPIFCGGVIKNFNQNVYNFRINEFVGYNSQKNDLNIELSSNLIFKLKEYGNQKLIAVLPYASYALKILREVNPTLGKNILIIDLNFFSILLFKLIKLSGANISIINLEKNDINYEKEIDDIDVYNDIDDAIMKFRKISIDDVINVSDLNQKTSKFLNNINFKNKFSINQISIYDVGVEDPNYIKGIKYPYPYVRWEYKENLKYFIYLVENKILNIDFLEIAQIKVASINALKQYLKKIQKNSMILFKLCK